MIEIRAESQNIKKFSTHKHLYDLKELKEDDKNTFRVPRQDLPDMKKRL